METWETFRHRETNRVYYGNRATGEASWTPPPPSVPLVPFPEDDVLRSWRAHRSKAHNDELFFLNVLTNERTWERPHKFYGMPEGEPEDHETGPFVKYVDEQDRAYYYNPRTKLVTRRHPKTLVSEEEAYELLRLLGGWFQGRPSENKDNTKKEEEQASLSSSESSSSDSEASSSDSDASSEEEEENDEELKQAFVKFISSKGVTKVSKWENWLTKKLQPEPEFQNYPPEKVRAWFEEHVKTLIEKDAGSKAKIIAEIKSELEAFIKADQTTRSSLLSSSKALLDSSECPQELKQRIAGLGDMEKNAILFSTKKRLGLN